MPTYEQPELPFDPPLPKANQQFQRKTQATPRLDYNTFSLERRIDELEKRIEALESAKPGRRGKAITISQEGVCGVDPECDSATCDKASVYRWQKGCRGVACGKAYREYYSAYRKKRRGTDTAEVDEDFDA